MPGFRKIGGSWSVGADRIIVLIFQFRRTGGERESVASGVIGDDVAFDIIVGIGSGLAGTGYWVEVDVIISVGVGVFASDGEGGVEIEIDIGGSQFIGNFIVGGVFGGVEGGEGAKSIGDITISFIGPSGAVVGTGIDFESFVVVAGIDGERNSDCLGESEGGVGDADLDGSFTGTEFLLDGLGDVLDGQVGNVEVLVGCFIDSGVGRKCQGSGVVGEGVVGIDGSFGGGGLVSAFDGDDLENIVLTDLGWGGINHFFGEKLEVGGNSFVFRDVEIGSGVGGGVIAPSSEVVAGVGGGGDWGGVGSVIDGLGGFSAEGAVGVGGIGEGVGVDGPLGVDGVVFCDWGEIGES